MKCPICGEEYDIEYDIECYNCGFNRIKTEFLNDEEYNMWIEETVNPCKAVYEHACDEYDWLDDKYDDLKEEFEILKNKYNNLNNQFLELKQDYQSVKECSKHSSNDYHVKLGLNDKIYEDENIIVTFLKWEYVHYLNTGNCYVATFLFENKTTKKKNVYFRNTSVGGFMNQEKTLSYDIPPRQKGMKNFNFIYEDRVPGSVNDFGSVEFFVCYGDVPDGFNNYIKGNVSESEELSIEVKL